AAPRDDPERSPAAACPPCRRDKSRMGRRKSRRAARGPSLSARGGRAGVPSWRKPRQEARMAARYLHRDLRRGVRTVIAGGVNAAGFANPVALGENANHLRPARVVLVGAVRGDVPLVWAQRSACGLLGLRL